MKFRLTKRKKDKPEDYELGKDIEADLDLLLEECREHLHSFNEELITKAFHWAVNAHKNKTRKSGAPYYTHPLQVARIVVAEIPLDDISVISALLHDVTDSSDLYTIKDIRSEFGATISEIVDNVSKIQNIEMHKIEQLENYRRLLLSMFKDVRIILIRLADRLQNMRTLDFLDLWKQKTISEETLEIYAPFAHRFGLGSIKWELEDLAFKHLNREKYYEIRNAIQLTRQERQDYIDQFIAPILEKLKDDALFTKNNIKYEIAGRPKHIYSIYNKTLLREKPIEELYDLFAIRVILDCEDHSYCFLTYGIISELYMQVPGTFKNYISSPKKNGYQSIHSAFIGKDGKPVEVQIRTRHMHEIAEKGFAAHFKYKRGFLPAKSVMDDRNIEEWMDMVRNIFENIGDEPPEQLLETFKRNLFIDEIYVFTPTNDFRIFPKDATPLDFAFAIHTDLGNKCIGAKVNGKVVPLDYKLASGDIIEILTSKTQKPSNQWLHFVVTNKAKTAIQKYLKDEKKKSAEEGKDLWNLLIRELSVEFSESQFTDFTYSLNYKDADDFYSALSGSTDRIGLNEFLKNKIKKSFDNLKVIGNGANEQNGMINGEHKTNGHKKPIRNSQAYDSNINIIISKCCYPVRGDIVVGFINPGKELEVHRIECPMAVTKTSSKVSPLIDIDWEMVELQDFESSLKLTGNRGSGTIDEITSAMLSSPGIAIQGFKFEDSDNYFTGYVTVSVKNKATLDELIEKLGKLKSIKGIERILE